MKTGSARQKTPRLTQEKLDRVKALLDVQSESEAIKQAVNLLLTEEDIKVTLRKIKGKARIEQVFR